jgi:TonB family protein
MGAISEHDREYRKRLMLISVVVVLVHFLLLVALEQVNVMKLIITFGYQGPPNFEPEITISNPREPASRVSSRERHMMIVENVFIVGEDKPERMTGKEPSRKRAEKPLEQMIALESPGESNFRTYASHAATPYREDYVILKMVKPEYPTDALMNLQEGYVLVEAYIAVDGTVNEAYVRSVSGPASFENSSITAVKQFLFRPVRVDGKPISFWVSFLVRFQLRR